MPSKSLAQHEAMCAASKGEGTTKIPKSVGAEFCHADKGAHFEDGGMVPHPGEVARYTHVTLHKARTRHGR